MRASTGGKSEDRWIRTVLNSGAFSDRIDAHTILLQESPVHNVQSLRYLVGLIDIKSRREGLAALDGLINLLTGGKILNPDAKLKPLEKQPLSALGSVTERERKALLTLWTYEAQLKDLFAQLIQALDGLLKDALDATRTKAVQVIATLLAYSPEQEQGLLTRLVNKVGDPTRTVATFTIKQLEKILQQHSNMKGVVVSEVERFLYRPNIATKAQYYALCFLSQILLDRDEELLANKLIIIYISFFKACVKKV